MGEHRFNPQAFGNLNIIPNVPALKDVYGRELHVGDAVILPHLSAPTLRVVKVAPNLDPGAPPNTMKVALQLVLVMLVRAGEPVQELVRVRTADEMGERVPAVKAEPATPENVVGDPLIKE